LISKKRSLQVIKMREDVSGREVDKEKSKDLRSDKNKDRNTASKKSQVIGGGVEKVAKINITKKYSKPLAKSKTLRSR
jgi:hypothetical protein